MKKICIVLVLWVFGGVAVVSAQLTGQLVVSPEYPKAYSPVTVSLQTYSFDADLATITWKVNDRVVASGLGIKKINITSGGTGELTHIEARAVLPNSDYIVITYDLSPQTVDLIWEAVESYVPPFYEGKALPGENSVVNVVAFPSFVEKGRIVNPKDVAYTWSVNDSVVSSKSGAGKQVLSTRLDYLRDSSVIAVVAKTPSGLVAESRITVYPKPILPLFFTYDDLLGVNYATALKNRVETTKDIAIKLEPFYISKTNNTETDNSYLWSLDGFPMETDTPTLVRLQPKDNSYGIKKISVSMENTRRRLQQAVASFDVVFDTR